ncbi:hypothetical protein CCACVL1_17928 [Corchorus capsularis]|uniref:Uncharacterized protein n=1 Tax=Corchorus capsularis TaxID=210143 RepID=A0A1R3HP84_COCAP|nr:hypothetical protein CCACVL1_17928 [Corchorus capsularis]
MAEMILQLMGILESILKISGMAAKIRLFMGILERIRHIMLIPMLAPRLSFLTVLVAAMIVQRLHKQGCHGACKGTKVQLGSSKNIKLGKKLETGKGK